MATAGKLFKGSIEELFPDLEFENKEKTIESFENILDSIFSNFSDHKNFQYMESKPEKISYSKHLSKIPIGVDHFELWLKSYVEEMSIQLTSELQKLVPPNIGLIFFAQLLDSHDFKGYFKKVKTPHKTKKMFKNGLNDMLEQKELKHFVQALSCACIGLNNAANSLNTLWVQSGLFEDEDFHNVINEAKKYEVKRNASLASNAKKNEKQRKIKEYAINLYVNGKYPSAKNCSENIASLVMDYAHNSDEIKSLSGKAIQYHENTLPRKIERWLGEYNKQQKALKRSNS